MLKPKKTTVYTNQKAKPHTALGALRYAMPAKPWKPTRKPSNGIGVGP